MAKKYIRSRGRYSVFKKTYQKVFVISSETTSKPLKEMNEFLRDVQGHILLTSLRNKDRIHYIVEYKI